MMTTVASTIRPVTSGAATVAAVFRGWLGAHRWTFRRNRRRTNGIADLDDHLLADIGLTRDDLRTAYPRPSELWPTNVSNTWR